MTNFINTATIRETSAEIIDAIFRVSGENEARAVAIWENGPSDKEMVAIIEIVTKNGMHNTADFVWGESGAEWANK